MVSCIVDRLAELGREFAAQPMLSRTHGQTASPTTVGKETGKRCITAYCNVRSNRFRAVELLGKINGAVGNYNAHLSAYADPSTGHRTPSDFIESLGLDL